MPPLPPSDLTLAQVELILRASEDRTSVHHGGDGPGHAHGRHVRLTNAQLADRVQGSPAGKVALFTAFVSTAEQVAAAAETLNSAEGKWARNQFLQGAPTARHPRGGHNGMWAKILHEGRVRNLRYAGGAGIIPIGVYFMIVARDDGRPCGLHVKTFYGTMREADPPHRASVFNRDNSPFSQGP